MGWLTDPQIWIALLTLVALELVLGVDNVIFITILAGALPEDERPRARTIGLAVAVLSRILLLFSLSWIIGLTAPMFTVFGFEVSGRDAILIVGGLFLLAKSTYEIHQRLEGVESHTGVVARRSFVSVIVQIFLLDVVFSLDSVITAVGMVDQLGIMVAAVMIAAGVMIVVAGPLGSFVDQHPTIKILALAFLLLIGFTLIVEGLHAHIPKGYIYFAMGFSVLVELLNVRFRQKRATPVKLHEAYISMAPLPPVPTPAPVKEKPTRSRKRSE